MNDPLRGVPAPGLARAGGAATHGLTSRLSAGDGPHRVLPGTKATR